LTETKVELDAERMEVGQRMEEICKKYICPIKN
jgi:hypothetical protein